MASHDEKLGEKGPVRVFREDGGVCVCGRAGPCHTGTKLISGTYVVPAGFSGHGVNESLTIFTTLREPCGRAHILFGSVQSRM